MTDSPFTPFAPAAPVSAPAEAPAPAAPKKRGPRRNAAAVEASAPAAPKKPRGRPKGSGNKKPQGSISANGAKPVKAAAPTPAVPEATGLDPLDALHHVSSIMDRVLPRNQPKVMAFLNKMFG